MNLNGERLIKNRLMIQAANYKIIKKKEIKNMKKERKLYTSFEQLPLTLNADDIAAYLNISRGNAYTLLHREDFPTLRIGKRMIAPRDKFLAWLDQQMSA